MITYKPNKLHRRLGAPRIAFNVFNYALIVFLSFLFLFPYWNVVVKALNVPADTALGGLTFWPRQFTLNNIWEILKDEKVLYGFRNTLIRLVGGSALSLVVLYMAAYALIRKGLRFKKAIYIILTIPNFISGGLIPTYILLGKLHLTNTLWVYIFLHAFSFYNLIVMRSYLYTIPDSLSEAARIDGANEFRIMFTVMVPLSKPIIATIALWLVVSHWNDWTTTLYYCSLKWRNYTLQYNLMQVLKESERIEALIQQSQENGQVIADPSLLMTPESIQAAQIVVSTLPILLAYPFIQRYFVQGVTIGSVKE